MSARNPASKAIATAAAAILAALLPACGGGPSLDGLLGAGGSAQTTATPPSFAFFASCLDSGCAIDQLYKASLSSGEVAAIGLAEAVDVEATDERRHNGLFIHQGKIYFGGYKAATGRELWVYDPNAAEAAGVNPRMVADTSPGTPSASPGFFASIDATLYYAASTSAAGHELWAYEPGQPVVAGTNPRLVADLLAGAAGSNPMFLTALGGKLYFGATHSTQGNELWVYDPELAVSNGVNPKVVFNIYAGVDSAFPSHLAEMDGKLYFRATTGTAGAEPWVYDPAAAVSAGVNPRQIDDIRSLSDGSDPEQFTPLAGILYFKVTLGAASMKVFRYDPAQAIVSGTNPRKAFDVTTATNESPNELVAANGKLYFVASDATLPGDDRELFAYDPATAVSASNPLKINLMPNDPSTPIGLRVLNGQLWFSTNFAPPYPLLSLKDGQAVSIGSNPATLMTRTDDRFHDLIHWTP